MFLIFMALVFQDMNSSEGPVSASKAKVHRGSSSMEEELSPQRNALITNFFRIHQIYSDLPHFLDSSDVKAALVHFLYPSGLLCSTLLAIK